MASVRAREAVKRALREAFWCVLTIAMAEQNRDTQDPKYDSLVLQSLTIVAARIGVLKGEQARVTQDASSEQALKHASWKRRSFGTRLHTFL